MTVAEQRARATPAILLAVHGLPPDEHTGTPLVARGYAAELAGRGWDVTVLYASAGAAGWGELRRQRRPGEAFWRVEVPPTAARGALWSLHAPSFPADPAPPAAGPDTAIAALLHALRPDVVHVVDNVDLPLSLPELAAARAIPVVRTVSCAEDLCALVAPVSPRSGPAGFCSAPLTAERCAECVDSVLGPASASWSGAGAELEPDPGVRRHDDRAAAAAKARHDELLRALGRKRARTVRHYNDVYDRVVFASEGFRRYFEATLPLPADRVRVVPMGVDPFPPAQHGPGATQAAGQATAGETAAAQAAGQATASETAAAQASSAQASSAQASAGKARTNGTPGDAAPGPLRLLLLGLADPAKGIGAVVEAFTGPALAGRDDWRLVLAGGGDRSAFGALLHDPRVSDRGPYRPGDLPRLLAEAEVGISSSVFETFHRVTREYLAAGLAVVGSGAFGITDAVVPGVNGLRFDHREEGSLAAAVVALADDRLLVRRLRDGARATAVRTVADEVDDLQALYREVAPAVVG